jgi:hypothetical protein
MKIYAIGGWNRRALDEIIVVDPSPQEIVAQVFGHLPKSFADLAVAVVNDKLYLIGGAGEKFQQQIAILEIDPATGRTRSLKMRSFLWW